MRYWGIAGYAYRNEIFCPLCVVPAIDGQAPMGEEREVESRLDYLAVMLGIDRGDEDSFWSGDFPKLISETEGRMRKFNCTNCGEGLCET